MRQGFVVGLVGLLACIGPVQALDMGIITGQPEGTYYQIGQNLRTLLEREDIALTVYPSSGSLENVEALYKLPNVQLAIAQADVLGGSGKGVADPGSQNPIVRALKNMLKEP